MNAQTLEYFVYKGGSWVALFELNYRDGMPVPNKGFILFYDGCKYEVTKVVFNISNAAIEIEVTKLSN